MTDRVAFGEPRRPRQKPARIVLGWLYARGRHSILLVAAAHAAFNLTTASAGARSIAVIETIAVMVLAAWIARHERTASQRASLRLIPFVS